MRVKVVFGQNIMICIEFKLIKPNSQKLLKTQVESSPRKIAKEYMVNFS